MAQPKNESVLYDFHTSEDASVYKITDKIYMVQTVDFFTPIVDNPEDFGEIAAANALSDIYAMGANPVTALSIVCFPHKKLPSEYLHRIHKGGLKKLTEAKTALTGGHSLKDSELKFGYAVTGLVSPENLLLNNSINYNDDIILTKPIGTGIINTAQKNGKSSQASIQAVTASMKELNNKPLKIAAKYNISACTDITGFGLIGHLYEMIDNTDFGLSINFKNISLFKNVKKYVKQGMVPGGTYSNLNYLKHKIDNISSIPQQIKLIIFDPQTSGGLAIAISKKYSKKLLNELQQNNIKASIIGEVIKLKNKIKIEF